jgi:hypothetical protein
MAIDSNRREQALSTIAGAVQQREKEHLDAERRERDGWSLNIISGKHGYVSVDFARPLVELFYFP